MPTTLLRPLVIVLSALVVACVAPKAVVTPATTPPAILAAMNDYAGDGPGAALLIIQDGKPVLRQGFGFADLEAGRKVTPTTSFRLASVSKQFTATAILLLAQDGTLSIDDPIRRWLPELPVVADAITLRQLLSHTSGLYDYEDLMDPADSRQVHDRDVLRLLESEDRLYFTPGSSYRYSNSGYALLTLVVERVSGQRYADFLQKRVFAPLGMMSIALEEGRSQVPDRAWGYSWIDGQWQRTDQSTTSAVLGDGGIYASIDDLARWDTALREGRLLGEPWRSLAVAPATPTDEADVDFYGFGWRLHGDLQWHSGETIGFRNVILRWPACGFSVVLLTNRNDPEPYALARRIASKWHQSNGAGRSTPLGCR